MFTEKLCILTKYCVSMDFFPSLAQPCKNLCVLLQNIVFTDKHLCFLVKHFFLSKYGFHSRNSGPFSRTTFLFAHLMLCLVRNLAFACYFWLLLQNIVFSYKLLLCFLAKKNWFLTESIYFSNFAEVNLSPPSHEIPNCVDLPAKIISIGAFWLVAWRFW